MQHFPAVRRGSHRDPKRLEQVLQIPVPPVLNSAQQARKAMGVHPITVKQPIF
jgi:hypothetical protein